MNLYLSSDPWFLLLFSLFCHIDLYSKAAIANDMSNLGHCFPNINTLVTYIFYILKGFTSNFNALREMKLLLLLNLKCSGPLKHLHPMTEFSTFNSFEDYSDEKSIYFLLKIIWCILKALTPLVDVPVTLLNKQDAFGWFWETNFVCMVLFTIHCFKEVLQKMVPYYLQDSKPKCGKSDDHVKWS